MGKNTSGKLTRKKGNTNNQLLKYHKNQCITHQVNENNKNTKGILKLVNKLTDGKKENPLPNKPPEQLADEFALYFLNKIQDIQKQFEGLPEFEPPHMDVPKFTGFSPFTVKQVRKVLLQMKKKSCELYTLSTDKFKEILDSCIITITKIVNILLTNGDFCDKWKNTIIKPLIKKLVLELINKNYRPVSNLCFLSQTCRKMHVGSTIRPLQH